MIAVAQRVSAASVSTEGRIIGSIGRGLLVLAAVERRDGPDQARWLAGKLAGLRVFPDLSGARAFDLDVRQAGGALLLVSNFTLAADCGKGRRPSLEGAAAPLEAQPIFEHLAERLRAEGVEIQTGLFGADMQVQIANDGPVTFLIQSPR